MQPEELERLIQEGLADAEVRVSGDGRHFDAIVISDTFSGKSMLEQHRMVYAALGDRFDTDVVHALSIKTYTRKDWEK
ncbi:MAG: BolA/IbaG family iron-sulfur metabolism protein, partial [Gammaproteobacteria bacterium]|nr:BolA/IbaG family iron-sulfur metabolism protein [Gammaproteobacteria bacterium]